MDTQKFIERARKVHGDTYDYSNAVYKNCRTDVVITCKIHGDFEQRPLNHTGGAGCPKCSGRIQDTKTFIDKAKGTHGDTYDYGNTNYVNAKTKVIITCKIHGDFEQRPSAHLSGQGCKKCANEKLSDSKLISTCSFIDKSKSLFEDLKYLKTEYVGYHEPITITCETHGDFITTPDSHFKSTGCPHCARGKQSSTPEAELAEYIQSKTEHNVIRNDRNLLNGKEVDVYISDLKVAFEFNGLYTHSEVFVHNKYHLDKTDGCKEKGVRLIHIFEDDWKYKRGIVESVIDNVLGVTRKKIYARKCKVKEVSPKDAAMFLENNHLQGTVGATHRYGLFCENEMVSIMCFSTPRKRKKEVCDFWELSRFCNKVGTTVVGGASKLLSHFKKTHLPQKIVSYADRTWSSGDLYFTLGFEYMGNTRISYTYRDGDRRRHKSNYKKKQLEKQGLDTTNTEHQIMKSLKKYRIYDCGKMIFEWNRGVET